MTTRHVLLALLPLLVTPVSHGDPQDAEPTASLVQLRFDGVLSGADRIEVEIGALVETQARRLDVHVFLGAGTTGADLAALVSSRLESSDFHAHLGAPSGDGQGRSLFIERTLFLNVRVGSGLTATATTCERPPTSIRLTSAPEGGSDLDLVLSAGTYHMASKSHRTEELSFALEAGDHEARTSERLHGAASEAKWVSDRPLTENWRPIRMVDGARFTGMSLRIGNGWRLEMDLR